MEEFSAQTQTNAVDKGACVVLDIKSLAQYPKKCPGSPKMTKMLSRKGSNRMGKQNGDDLEPDVTSKKIVVKVACLQIEQLKQPPTSNNAFVAVAANMASLTDAGDGRSKRFSRLSLIHPRNVLFFFATLSSMGTMLLIYFTLAINHRGDV